MEHYSHYVTQVVDYLRTGFNHVNAVPGLLIALAATAFMQSWRQLFAIALLAVAATLAIELMIPVMANHAAFHLPAMVESAFWKSAVSLYCGYLLVIGVFFAAKRLLFRKTHHEAPRRRARA